jgi:hypothetical protein
LVIGDIGEGGVTGMKGALSRREEVEFADLDRRGDLVGIGGVVSSCGDRRFA